MEELKNIVIQSLEQQGTLSTLKAQLRQKVFEAIEQNADQRTKQQAGFQWQNPNVEKIHSNEESLLSAHLIREYFDHFKMDYTKSVYIPECALDKAVDYKQTLKKQDLLKKVGIEQQNGPDSQEAILVQILRQFKLQQLQIQNLQSQLDKYHQSQQITKVQNAREKNNSQQSSHSQISREGTPSPLMQQQQQLNQQYKQQQINTKPNAKQEQKVERINTQMKKYDDIENDDDIQEEIYDEVDNLNMNQVQNGAGIQRPKGGQDPLSSSDNLGGMSGGISSSGANAIDHSIDTLQLEQYDYVEEVRFN